MNCKKTVIFFNFSFLMRWEMPHSRVSGIYGNGMGIKKIFIIYLRNIQTFSSILCYTKTIRNAQKQSLKSFLKLKILKKSSPVTSHTGFFLSSARTDILPLPPQNNRAAKINVSLLPSVIYSLLFSTSLINRKNQKWRNNPSAFPLSGSSPQNHPPLREAPLI